MTRSLDRSQERRVAPLRFHDAKLRDCSGQPVTLRGCSLFWSCWAPDLYNASAVEWLAVDWKIGAVRAALAGPEAMDQAIAVIEGAIVANVYVVVDWHSAEANTAAAAGLLGGIARRYGDLPNILYESWNEPPEGADWGHVIRPHHEAVIDAVRQYAPSAPFVVGTPDYCKRVEVAVSDPVARANVGYALHFYAGTHRNGLRDRARGAVDAGVPLFVSEWGLAEASGDGVIDFQEAENWLRFLNDSDIGHLNWAIGTKAEACSALFQNASPRGAWRASHLTKSGRFMRDYLRRQQLCRRPGS